VVSFVRDEQDNWTTGNQEIRLTEYQEK
jgi:hypothetical protein